MAPSSTKPNKPASATKPKKSIHATSRSASSILYSTFADAIGQVVTIETNDGCSYRGKLDSVDSASCGFNMRLSCVLVTLPNGAKDAAMSITIPGRNQKLVLLPATMKFAPRFNDVRSGNFSQRQQQRGGGGGGARGNLKHHQKKKPGASDGAKKKSAATVSKWGSKLNALNKKKAKKE